MLIFAFELQEGPLGGHTNGDINTDYFMFVTGQPYDYPQSYAQLTSPRLLAKDHPVECLSFWIQAKVGIS